MNQKITLVAYVNRMPRAISLQHAMKQVASDNPPLVVEFDGENHFGAWVRNVQMHKGPKVVDGLTREFPGLLENGWKRKAETKGTGQGGAAKKPQHSTKKQEVPKPQRRHKHKQGHK